MYKMLTAIAESIFEPGVNSQLLKAVNITFICLIFVGIVLIFLTGFNIHLVFLLVLSSGLLISINWFVKELWQAKQDNSKTEKTK